MKKIDEHEFLPSAVEIVERPPSPLGTLVIWIISMLILSGILWSILGRVDVVASARGRIVPVGRMKAVQPLEEGIIKEIYVEEGQRVSDGELLVELDSTIREADTTAIRKTLSFYELEREITARELSGTSLSLNELLKSYQDLERERVVSEYSYYLSRERNHRGRMEEIGLGIIQGKSQLNIARSNLRKMRNQLDFLEKEEENYRYLKEIGGVKENDWLRKKNEVETLRYDMGTQVYQVNNMETEVEELEKQLENIGLKREVELSDKAVELEKEILSLESELVKVEKAFGLKKLYSPVDGRVNEVRISTIGGVVKPGDPVVTIVPEDSPLEIELLVLNKDIGFVKEEQEAEIKLDTFPFQKHGTIKGRVYRISPDAFEDESRGMVYRVSVRIDENNVKNQGEAVTLGSGMTLTGEIKTGRRRVIEFFLSPLMKYADEGIKVR